MLTFQIGVFILRTVLRTTFINQYLYRIPQNVFHCKLPLFKILLREGAWYILLYFLQKYSFLHQLYGRHFYTNTSGKYCHFRQNRIHFLYVFFVTVSFTWLIFLPSLILFLTKIEENLTSFTSYFLHMLPILIISSSNLSTLKS